MADETYMAPDLSRLDCSIREFNGKTAGKISNKRQMMREAKKAEFQAKYGDDWLEHYHEYMNPSLDYDMESKLMNHDIYAGHMSHVTGTGSFDWILKSHSRMHDVYGDAFERLQRHEPGNLEAVEPLLSWAIRTGRWRELPDCLQDEYHRRVGSGDVGGEGSDEA